MFNQQPQGNPSIQTRDYSQGLTGSSDKAANSDKKGGRFPQYQPMTQPMSQAMTYGAIPDAMSGASAIGYYPQGYGFQPVYDARRMYPQLQSPYIPQGGVENQVKGPRPPMNSNQYYDMKRYVGADPAMGNIGYLPQYASQPQIPMYAPMMAAQPYQANAMMMSQQGYYSFGMNPQSMKREAPPNSLMGSDNKNGKKTNMNSPPFVINRMLNPVYSAVPQYPAMNPQYMQPTMKPAAKELPRTMPQTARMPPSYPSAAPKAVESLAAKAPEKAEAKSGISDVERTVASILCRMKANSPSQSAQAAQTVQSAQSAQPAQSVQSEQPGQPPVGANPAPEGAVSPPSAPSAPTAPADPVMPTMPTIPTIPTIPAMAPIPTIPTIPPMPAMAPRAPGSGAKPEGAPIVPSVKMQTAVNRSGGVPPIPSPPAAVLANNNLKTMVCGSHPPKEEGAVKPVEVRADIIPELKPEQLLMSRRHVHVREKPLEAPAPESLPSVPSIPPVQPVQSVQPVQPVQPIPPVQPSERVEPVADKEEATVKEETAVKEGATPIVPTKTEEEEVPLMRVPSTNTQEEEKVVPIMPEKETDME